MSISKAGEERTPSKEMQNQLPYSLSQSKKKRWALNKEKISLIPSSSTFHLPSNLHLKSKSMAIHQLLKLIINRKRKIR